MDGIAFDLSKVESFPATLPAADFVRLAARFESAVKVSNLTRGGDRQANARSLLEVTALGVNQGHTIWLEATGEDAENAVRALADLIRSNFGMAAGG